MPPSRCLQIAIAKTKNRRFYLNLTTNICIARETVLRIQRKKGAYPVEFSGEILNERKVREEGRKFPFQVCVCAINYENEAKSNDYFGRKAELKMSYRAISVPFSASRSSIGPRVCMYVLINPEYTCRRPWKGREGRGERWNNSRGPVAEGSERRGVLSPLSLRTLYYHPLPPPLSLSRRNSLYGGRPWYLRANRPVVRIEITSNSLIDITSCYKEIDSPERILP